MNEHRRNRPFLACAGLALAVASLGSPSTWGQTAPLSHMADPGVYKVVKENDLFRVVVATWKPGQRDAFHSHPATAVYYISPCKPRLYAVDGKVVFEGDVPQGGIFLQPAIASHAFENAGTTECKILIVERK